MIDLNLLKENPEVFEKGIKSKGISLDLKKVVDVEKNYRELFTQVQSLREERNIAARARDIEEGKELKIKLEEKEKELKDKELILQKLLIEIPNLPSPDVKVGIDERGNEVIRTYKEPTKLNFKSLDHVDLGEKLDIIDMERAAKVSGSRFAYLKNEAVFLEFALVQYALQVLVKENFTPVVPPVLIKPEITQGLGYWQAGGHNDYYLVYDPDEKRKEGEYQGYYLVGTAEHAIVPLHKDEILNKKDLPKRYVAFSSAFRREAGSYGKDTKGILRVHQFDKVEMVSFVATEDDDQEHEFLLGLEEKLFQSLEIPYQVVKMCSGDLGFPAARKYDIEAWLPSQEKYREVTSVSTVTDFQSRRLNIKYRDGEEKKYVHILNGTAFAIGRTIVAILENYQQEDGSVMIPEVLRKYTGFDKITPKNK